MSTRCVVTVRDPQIEGEDREEFHVYRHSEGYPNGEHGVLRTIEKALPYAWPLPRFEASDFSAALIAGWKTLPVTALEAYGADACKQMKRDPKEVLSQGGNIRMAHDYEQCDLAWRYTITRATHNGELIVGVFVREQDDEETGSSAWSKVFHGRLKDALRPGVDGKIVEAAKVGKVVKVGPKGVTVTKPKAQPKTEPSEEHEAPIQVQDGWYTYRGMSIAHNPRVTRPDGVMFLVVALGRGANTLAGVRSLIDHHLG